MNYLFENQMPVAKTNNLVVEELADEVLVYDEARHQAHCLNVVAAQVWRACDGNHTAQALAQKIGTTTDVVVQMLGQLDRAQLLQPSADKSSASGGISRRTMLRRTGIAVAGVAAGVAVSSITAPTAAQAASLASSGATVGDPSQCQSGAVDSNGNCI